MELYQKFAKTVPAGADFANFWYNPFCQVRSKKQSLKKQDFAYRLILHYIFLFMLDFARNYFISGTISLKTFKRSAIIA